MKKLRLLMMTLCVTVLMGIMAVTAYAGGGEEWDSLDPVEPPPAETVDPGEGRGGRDSAVRAVPRGA